MTLSHCPKGGAAAARGESQKSLSVKYGVTPGAVSQIVRGLKWVEQSVARENAA